MILIILGIVFIIPTTIEVGWRHFEIVFPAVNEEIGDFFSSINGSEQKIWYASEIYRRKLIGSTSLNKENLELLRTSNVDRKTISGPLTYHLLNDFEYKKDFLFKSIDHRQDSLDFKLSDTVTRMMAFSKRAHEYTV